MVTSEFLESVVELSLLPSDNGISVPPSMGSFSKHSKAFDGALC